MLAPAAQAPPRPAAAPTPRSEAAPPPSAVLQSPRRRRAAGALFWSDCIDA